MFGILVGILHCTMDRELAPELITKSRRKSWTIGAILLISLIAIIAWFKGILVTSVEASRIRSAVAQTGFVENTISATGEVIPAYEQIIASPIRASIRRVLLTPGTRVKPGQPILELDKSLTQLEYDKIADQLALKQNSIEQLRLKLNKELYDADVNDQIKSLTINKLNAEVNDAKRLLKVGGQTPEDVTRAENLLHIAQLEKKQLENTLSYNRQSMSASLKEYEIEARIEANNLKVLDHKLKQADILTDRAGVLTWVNEHVGSAVSEGEMLARLADLGSFRVEGSCSDMYAEQVKTGQPVIIKINETPLRGQITQVKPAVQNGVIQFAIELDNNRHTALRPNQKVEVFIVTNRAAKTIRVANGPAFKGKQKQYVYVLTSPNVAKRREVEIGLSNFDWVEIKSGLQVGERVILTDLSEYEHLEQLTIKQ